jgi:regulator of replication initiation timing
MERVKDLIKEYLLNTIQTKRNMRKRIYQLEDQIREYQKNEKYLIEQKEKYKKSNTKLRRKLKER